MITLRDWFLGHGWTERWAVTGAIVAGLVAAALLAELFRAVAPALVSKIVRPKKGWVAAFQKRRVFRGAAWVVIVMVIDSLVTPLLEPWPKTLGQAETILNGALVVAVTVAISKLIAAFIDTYEVQDGKAQRLPLKALGQALQLSLWTYASVVLLSVLSQRDVTTLLTGLTAIGAVLVYVFRDPILGWTAGVQIAANDLARIGDWITVPDHDADGWVIEIALTTIKVRNWDKTISTIPTYSLVSEGFRNWRGMYESGGRRIKRSVAIDANSVRPCDDVLLDRLRAEGLLGTEPAPEPSNLACFRRWLETWLKEHPEVNHEMTTMVRELAPEERGIPVEIYAFSRDTSWVTYEHLQADIYDRVLAVLPRAPPKSRGAFDAKRRNQIGALGATRRGGRTRGSEGEGCATGASAGGSNAVHGDRYHGSGSAGSVRCRARGIHGPRSGARRASGKRTSRDPGGQRSGDLLDRHSRRPVPTVRRAS